MNLSNSLCRDTRRATTDAGQAGRTSNWNGTIAALVKRNACPMLSGASHLVCFSPSAHIDWRHASSRYSAAFGVGNMTNAIMRKFGHPRRVLAETKHWTVLVRPQQVTLGSLVLTCQELQRHTPNLKRLPPYSRIAGRHHAPKRSSFNANRCSNELRTSERRGFCRSSTSRGWHRGDTEGIHFIQQEQLSDADDGGSRCIISRYKGTRSLGEIEFPDAGWPGALALGKAIESRKQLCSTASWRPCELVGAGPSCDRLLHAQILCLAIAAGRFA